MRFKQAKVTSFSVLSGQVWPKQAITWPAGIQSSDITIDEQGVKI